MMNDMAIKELIAADACGDATTEQIGTLHEVLAARPDLVVWQERMREILRILPTCQESVPPALDERIGHLITRGAKINPWMVLLARLHEDKKDHRMISVAGGTGECREYLEAAAMESPSETLEAIVRRSFEKVADLFGLQGTRALAAIRQGQCHGSVVSRDSTPIAGVEVVWTQAGKKSQAVRTDPGGRFSFDGIQANGATIHVGAPVEVQYAWP